MSELQDKKKTKLAKCDNCNNEFLCQPFRVREHENGKRKKLFCCKKCEGEYRRKQSELNCTCPICGKKFHRKNSKVEKTKNVCCSMVCANQLRKTTMSGENNHQYGLLGSQNSTWKSDERISSYGYKLIRVLDHPFRNTDDFVFEHRLVAEKYLLDDNNSIIVDGIKYLKPELVVHHIDKNRLNNSPDNLIVMTREEHTAYHKKHTYK